MKEISLVTFNIRITEDDGANSWPYRKAHVISKIKCEKPDLIGFQELTDESLSDLQDALVDYVFIGCGREKDLSGEAVMIAYHKSKLDLIMLDIFWLSDTPDVLGSVHKDSSGLARPCGVAIFKTRNTNQLFRIYNTHYDHEGEKARVDSTIQLLKDIEKRQNQIDLPTFLMGDLNATPNDSEIMSLSTEKQITLTDLTKTVGVSFHDYGKTAIKIDYIFATNNVLLKDVSVWNECFDGVYLSDHYPIEVKVLLTNI